MKQPTHYIEIWVSEWSGVNLGPLLSIESLASSVEYTATQDTLYTLAVWKITPKPTI